MQFDKPSKFALKNKFLARARSLVNQAESYRAPLLTSLLAEALAVGIPAEPEFFSVAYGNPRGVEYWYGLLSEPIPVYKFAYALAVHVAERADQLQPATVSIIQAARDAAETGEAWLLGDTAPLLALDNRQRDFESLSKIKVRPLAAVRWLLSKPRRQHLVPLSLREFARTEHDRSGPSRGIENFVATYIDGEQRQGKRPTIEGLETTAKNAGLRGHRDQLRAAFNRRMGGKRGRPTKATAKTAEK